MTTTLLNEPDPGGVVEATARCHTDLVNAFVKRSVGLLCGIVVVVACTDGLPAEVDDDDGGAERPAAADVAPAEERSTPFCSAMTDLSDRLENDPPEDVAAAILEVYRSIADEVPEVLAVDFAAVIADLEGVDRPVATTRVPDPSVPDPSVPDQSVPDQSVPDDPLPDEGFSPDETPAGRVNAYVGFVCRGVVNNPGPPDTQPPLD